MKSALEEDRYVILRLSRNQPGLVAVIGDTVNGLQQAKEIVAQLSQAAAPDEIYKWRKVRQQARGAARFKRRKPWRSFI